jgi:hypothetical protein
MGTGRLLLNVLRLWVALYFWSMIKMEWVDTDQFFDFEHHGLSFTVPGRIGPD